MRKSLALLFFLLPISAHAQTYFAHVGPGGVIDNVIVADQAFINSGKVGNPSEWVQTRMNGGIRKNYAGRGFTYDTANDRFIPPKPREWHSWRLNPDTAQWEAPVQMPVPDGQPWRWDEARQKWYVEQR